jgi:hypothetical protein
VNNQYFISKPFYDAVESACKTLENSKISVEREMAAQSPPYAGEVLNLLLTRLAEIDLEISALQVFLKQFQYLFRRHSVN